LNNEIGLKDDYIGKENYCKGEIHY